MTKHESHIILLLLALITAGVLGYQFANSGFDNRTDIWSNALLNSNSENRHFDIEIDIQPPAHSGSKAHQETSALKNSRGEERYRYSEIPGFFYMDEGNMNIPAASNSQTDHPIGARISAEHSQANGSYLYSDVPRESISLILGGSSPERTKGALFSIETLLHDIPEKVTAGHSNDHQENRIVAVNSRHVEITQVSDENSAIVTGTDAGNYTGAG